jgi:hypothetical protein
MRIWRLGLGISHERVVHRARSGDHVVACPDELSAELQQPIAAPLTLC